MRERRARKLEAEAKKKEENIVEAFRSQINQAVKDGAISVAKVLETSQHLLITTPSLCAWVETTLPAGMLANQEINGRLRFIHEQVLERNYAKLLEDGYVLLELSDKYPGLEAADAIKIVQEQLKEAKARITIGSAQSTSGDKDQPSESKAEKADIAAAKPEPPKTPGSTSPKSH